EAAHKAGVKRIVYASSSHVTGFYPVTELVEPSMPLRPDGYYGISKGFGEMLSRYYFDRFGIETVCLRIGSCFPTLKDRPELVMHLSYGDLVELVRCALFARRVNHTIVYGTSDNDPAWWDNRSAAHLGFKPKDSSRDSAHLFPDTAERPADDDVGSYFQGGLFTTLGPQYKD
ncbi:MAG: NAD-dependent epimerase/dehydratase family protein, partial [Gammaproteobacteria bacterium]